MSSPAIHTKASAPSPGWHTASQFLSELLRRDRLLTWTGLLNLGLAVLATLLLMFDPREVGGINAWIKPLKFCLSITIYTWTFAWLVEYLRHRPKTVRIVSVGTSVCMLMEIAGIFGQAARGTSSHFNFDGALNIAVFSMMGNFIAINTVLAVLMLILFWLPGIRLEGAYLWGIRTGLIVFLAGSAVGGQMIALGAHSIGTPDGGPGLPFVNWARDGGDLRIAHGLGLHALQILPLLGYVVSRRRLPQGVFALGTAVYVVLLSVLYLQAMAGRSLLG